MHGESDRPFSDLITGVQLAFCAGTSNMAAAWLTSAQATEKRKVRPSPKH